MGYAGRLDPMAEGLLLIMVGEECKRRYYYQRLDKEYEADILFGISTDSYDVLGLVDKMLPAQFSIDTNKLRGVLGTFIGMSKQRYPPFSAYRMGGKSLYTLSREGSLDHRIIPSKNIRIDDITCINIHRIRSEELLASVMSKVNSVAGNFRQEEIMHKWESVLSSATAAYYPVATLKISCASGTYIRTLAHDIGRKMNVPGMVFHLKRTRIGTFRLP